MIFHWNIYCSYSCSQLISWMFELLQILMNYYENSVTSFNHSGINHHIANKILHKSANVYQIYIIKTKNPRLSIPTHKMIYSHLLVEKNINYIFGNSNLFKWLNLKTSTKYSIISTDNLIFFSNLVESLGFWPRKLDFLSKTLQIHLWWHFNRQQQSRSEIQRIWS